MLSVEAAYSKQLDGERASWRNNQQHAPYEDERRGYAAGYAVRGNRWWDVALNPLFILHGSSFLKRYCC